MLTAQDTYEVKIWLRENSQPMVYRALATYEKGSFFCIAYVDKDNIRQVRKFPVASIGTVEEEYKYIGFNGATCDITGE